MKPWKAPRHSARRRSAKWHSAQQIINRNTQHNDTQHTQDDINHNATRYSVIILSDVMLNVIMLSVIMLNVVAPHQNLPVSPNCLFFQKTLQVLIYFLINTHVCVYSKVYPAGLEPTDRWWNWSIVRCLIVWINNLLMEAKWANRLAIWQMSLWGARKLTGDNLNANWAEFSTLS
jgi:hypothetical protein